MQTASSQSDQSLGHSLEAALFFWLPMKHSAKTNQIADGHADRSLRRVGMIWYVLLCPGSVYNLQSSHYFFRPKQKNMCGSANPTHPNFWPPT